MIRLTLIAALAGAAALPGGPPGVGVVAVAALLSAAVVHAARRAGTLSAQRIVLLVLALALAATAVLRDAGWVVAIDLVAAWSLAALATAGPRLESLLIPFVGLVELRATTPRSLGHRLPVARGVALTVLLLVPFVALFWRADEAFASLAGGVPIPNLSSWPARALWFGLVLIAGLGLARTIVQPPAPGRPRQLRRLSAVESFVPLAGLNLLFGLFVGVQATVLFGGRDHVLETAGLTYAEYARHGFWELLAASALTVIVVGAAHLFGADGTRREQLLLRGLTAALCVSTIVIVVSALYRLGVYEDAFGLTRLRLGAEAIAVWLGLGLAVGGLAIATGRLRRGTTLAVPGTAAALLAFTLVNPDAWIARRNVERWSVSGRIDVAYAASLSADATPALLRLSEPIRGQVLTRVAEHLASPEPWGSWNRSRDRARDLLAQQAP